MVASPGILGWWGQEDQDFKGSLITDTPNLRSAWVTGDPVSKTTRNILKKLMRDALCCWSFLSNLQSQSLKNFSSVCQWSKDIDERKLSQYLTWDGAGDAKGLLPFFRVSICGCSIKQPPNNSKPTTISKRSILVFVALHMFEVWHNPYGTH